MLAAFRTTARGEGSLRSAVSHSLFALQVPGIPWRQAFLWSAIIPLFSVFLLSGCGGLSVAGKNAIVATPSTVSFGSVAVGQTVTANITLQNRGFNTVQIESLNVSGSAFSVVASTSFPITLAAGASVTVQLQFTPTTLGSTTEPLMITSSLSTDPAAIAQATGTGTSGSSKTVQLNWNAPSSSTNLIAGYNVYRSEAGAGYQQLNPTIDRSTSYADTTVQSGKVYDYYVESVDSAGAISAPSNTTTVSVP